MNSNILLSKLRTAGIKSVDSGKIKTIEIREYYGFPNSFSIFSIYIDGILRGQLDEHNTDKVVEEFINNFS